MAPQTGPGSGTGPQDAPRQPWFARAIGLGTFVFVCCGAVASTGDTQRFAVLAIAVGVGWAVLRALGRRLGAINSRDTRRAVGALMIVSVLSDMLRWPPGDG